MKAGTQILIIAFVVASILSVSSCSLTSHDNSLNGNSTITSAAPLAAANDFEAGRIIVQFKGDVVSRSGNAVTLINALAPNYAIKAAKRLVSDENVQRIKTRQLNVGKVSTSQAEKTSMVLVGLMLLEYSNVTKNQTLDIVQSLKQNPSVEYAEVDGYEYATSVVPNDTYYGNLWGMTKIKAPQAWGWTTGSSSVIVAVIDTGADYNHMDLSSNMMSGYDYCNNDSDPMDDNGHGTHVTGTIGAVGNNSLGVVGVAWNVKIMPLKFLNSNGRGYTSDAIECIDYAIAHGAEIMNSSWGSSTYEESLRQAVIRARDAGILFVAAAGNVDGGNDNDVNPFYPASYDVDNILSVASVDSSDALSSFSCYGATTVDIAAPGEDIYSTIPENSYGYLSGTSMAAPHVTGAAVLLKSIKPSLSYSQIKSVFMNKADYPSGLNGKVVSGGRLNVSNALNFICTPVLNSPLSPYVMTGPVNFSWFPVDGVASYDLIVAGPNGSQTNNLSASTTNFATNLLACGSYTWSVTANGDNGTSATSVTNSFTVVYASPQSLNSKVIDQYGNTKLSWENSPTWPVGGLQYFIVDIRGKSYGANVDFSYSNVTSNSITGSFSGIVPVSWAVTGVFSDGGHSLLAEGGNITYETPVILSPTNGRTFNRLGLCYNEEFSVQASTDVLAYHMQITGPNGYTNDWDTSMTGPSVYLPYVGAYQYSVYIKHNDGSFSLISSRSFNAGPDTPSNLSETKQGSSYTLSWNETSPLTTGFEVVWWSKNNPGVNSTNLVSAASNSFTVSIWSGLLPVSWSVTAMSSNNYRSGTAQGPDIIN